MQTKDILDSPKPRPHPAWAEFKATLDERGEASLAGAGHGSTLPVIDPRDWQDKPIPDREWFVYGMIPHRTVTQFSGDGGSGKTQTAIQLIVAASIGGRWLGPKVGCGPCLIFTTEDESDELWRRLATTVAYNGHQLRDLDGVRLIPMAGRDVKGDPDRRVLKVMKANYSRTGEEIAIRWNDGVYVVDTGDDPAVVGLANATADDVFLSVFLKLTGLAPSRVPPMHPSASPNVEMPRATPNTRWPMQCSGYLMPECYASKRTGRHHVVMTCWWRRRTESP